MLALFLRLGVTSFGGPAAHVALMQRECVERRHWIDRGSFLDMLVAATVSMFAPAFVLSALSSVALDRLKTSRVARAFLDGVNAAAVALIAVVAVSFGRSAFNGVVPVLIGVSAAVALFAARMNPTLVLLAAAVAGAVHGLFDPGGR